MAATHSFKGFLDGDRVTTGEVHWGAVIAGIMVALVGQLLLTLLGAGLGAASFDASAGASLSGEDAAWGAFLWWAVSGIASAFAGGWAAGWACGAYPSTDRIEGSFQGFLSWAGSVLIVAIVVLGLAGGSAVSTRLGGPLALPAGAEVAAESAAAGALASFFALLLGAAAAMAGGYFGVSRAKRMIAQDSAKATSAPGMPRPAT